MAFSVYMDYLKEAGLYESFRKDCENVSWKIINPDMFLAAMPAFIYEHCSAPLDAFVSELLGQEIRIRPSIGANYDEVVYFKWILSSIHRKMKDDSNREERDIIKNKRESRETRKQELDLLKKNYTRQEGDLIGFLIMYGQKDSPELLPDEAISLYREFWKLSNWNGKNWDRRPDYAELRSLKPLVIDIKYHMESYVQLDKAENKHEGINLKEKRIPAFKVDFKVAGDQFVEGIKGRMDDFQRIIDSRNNETRKIEEKLKKQKKPYEIQEMMEFISFMDLVIANCAKKYF